MLETTTLYSPDLFGIIDCLFTSNTLPLKYQVFSELYKSGFEIYICRSTSWQKIGLPSTNNSGLIRGKILKDKLIVSIQSNSFL